MPKEEKTVDIDSSGPDTEVEIKEDKEKGLENEITQDSPKPDDTSEKLDEHVDVRDSKDDKEPEKKEEVKEEKKEELEQ